MPSLVKPTSNGGGGGRKIELEEGGGGGSNDDEPEPQVLGEQVTIVPAGAPNAGAGGTATGSTGGVFTLLATLIGLLTLRFKQNA